MTWTTREEALLTAMWRGGKALKEIVIATGHSKNAVMTRRAKLGLPPRYNARVSARMVKVSVSEDLRRKLGIAAERFNSTISNYVRVVLEEAMGREGL